MKLLHHSYSTNRVRPSGVAQRIYESGRQGLPLTDLL